MGGCDREKRAWDSGGTVRRSGGRVKVSRVAHQRGVGASRPPTGEGRGSSGGVRGRESRNEKKKKEKYTYI